MKNTITLVLAAIALAFTACKAKTEADVSSLSPTPSSQSSSVQPTLSCKSEEPMNGKLGDLHWQIKSGVAFASGFQGMWDVTFYDSVVADPCHNFGPGRAITVGMPQTLGDFHVSENQPAVFYDMTVTPQMTTYTSNGQGHIDEITASQITGTFEAYVDGSNGLCGRFKITRCQ